MKQWKCVQNGVTQWQLLADEVMKKSPHGELSCLHKRIPELCNAILNTWQMAARDAIPHLNVISKQTGNIQNPL